MKLHRELTTRTILRRRPRTHNHRLINPALAHLSGPSPPNNPATSAAGQRPELRMTEQTHCVHARPLSGPVPPSHTADDQGQRHRASS